MYGSSAQADIYFWTINQQVHIENLDFDSVILSSVHLQLYNTSQPKQNLQK